MKRRTFVAGVLSLPLLGFARFESLSAKKALFEELGNSVLMTIALPTLFRRGDIEALDSVDSGLDTTLSFMLRLWNYTTREVAGEQTITVKLRRDLWSKRYVVRTHGERGWTRKEFATREQACEAVTTLSRVRIASSSALARGSLRTGPWYWVEILALRNPIKSAIEAAESEASGRERGRDLEWFGRAVEVLAGERAIAEEIVHVRTNCFFLPPR